MYCSRCGYLFQENSSFCGHCGQPTGTPTGNIPRHGFAPQGYYAPPSVESVPDHLVWSILATLFCFGPLGIVAIVYSALALRDAREGRVVEARRSAATALQFIWYSVYAYLAFVGVMLVSMLCFFLFPLLILALNAGG